MQTILNQGDWDVRKKQNLCNFFQPLTFDKEVKVGDKVNVQITDFEDAQVRKFPI